MATALAVGGCDRLPGRPDFLERSTGMVFVRVPAGTFTMGVEGDEIRPSPPHVVRIGAPFYMGAMEVTQGQWHDVMGTAPSHFATCGPNCPVETVSWYETLEFIDRLSERTGLAFRLPTEAEWEYACRAGTTSPWSTGDALTVEQANYNGRAGLDEEEPVAPSRRAPTSVASFPPNAWGLFEMHGNVWEWTADEYCPYATSEVTDPFQRCGSGLKNIRGGSWAFSARAARCGNRYTHDPADRGYSLGFRLVLDDTAVARS